MDPDSLLHPQFNMNDYYNEYRLNSMSDMESEVGVKFVENENSTTNQSTVSPYNSSSHIYGSQDSRASVLLNENWNVFNEFHLDDSNHGDKVLYNRVVKTVKLIAYVVVFLVVLTGAVISKGSLLFMTSQIRADRKTPYCQLPNTNPDQRYAASSNQVEIAQWQWAIFFTYITPEIFTLGRSYRLMFFKSVSTCSMRDFLIAGLFETLHTIGVALLLFIALPELDVVKGAMLTNCLCFIPAVLAPLARTKVQFGKGNENRFYIALVMDVLAILAQATGFVIWPFYMFHKFKYGFWAIPVGIFLTSFGWWENYVDEYSAIHFIRYLGKLKLRLRKGRYFVYAILPIWKIVVFFGCMTAFVYITNSDKSGWDRLPFLENFMTLDSRLINVKAINVTVRYLADTSYDGGQTLLQASDPSNAGTQTVAAVANAALLTWTIQFLCTWVCYIFGKFACRVCIQSFSYAFPVNLAIPITVTLLVTFCGVKQNDVCFMKNMLPRYLYWVCPDDASQNIFMDSDMTWIWIVWLFSQTWITMHIWLPKCERLASTEKLFVTPMYSGAFVDQSLAMNRQRFEGGDIHVKELDSDIPMEVSMYESVRDSARFKKPATKTADQITHIIACATMWHETDEEMIEMFKSILRMDADQCARRNAQKYFEMIDPDYYEFETQIFFDDAFEICDDDWDESVVNRFVKSAIKIINTAANEVHGVEIEIRPPTKIPTPYGGRLVWTLPGKTQMIIHLKDKSKIRHRKRWSQVMYMYYLLGFRIMAAPYDIKYKENIAENTYILALDGDIDFQPDAVQLLVDLMKKNKNLGASCGRIHPIGSGMMVWYQKFEYAIGHWLQKATEHMIGCVLCSPGCFSLFRASALMDDNVMKTYTFTPTEARHYVQYDQGEDRWLCTLLLQQGYRVEYSAASDAYTHAPEGFGEFYNQRRRWVPSTMANILDLLSDAGKTVKLNDDISTLYIIYQGMLMVGTILGPGTIFLMMVGAFGSAFNVSLNKAFYLNAIPLVIFMIMCVAAKPNNQVLCAQILTCFYALVMLAVLVGVLLQVSYSGWGSPTTFLTLLLPMTMITAALLHPLEITCLFWGWLYWLIIPSMYMLLMIYSYANMNNVSWGTREVVQKKNKQELEEEKRKLEEAKKKQMDQNFVLNFFGMKDKEMDGGFAISCANLCSFLLCTHPKPKDDQIQLMAIQHVLDKIVSRLELIEKSVDNALPGFNRRRSAARRSLQGIRDPLGMAIAEEGDEEEENSRNSENSDDEDNQRSKKPIRNELNNPLWIEDKILTGEKSNLPDKETAFWKQLIDTYLFPIDENKEEKARIMVELKELRNKVIFAFFMLNAIFIVIVLLMQLNKDQLYINWPLGATSNITWTDETDTIKITMIYQHLQPIGFVFMIFFAVVIVIQFCGMILHRFETISHILASTVIECLSTKPDEKSMDAVKQKNGVQLARELQRFKGFNEPEINDDNETFNRNGGRRMTIHKIERAQLNRQKQTSLDKAFQQRLNSINPTKKNAVPVLKRMNQRRETIQILVNANRRMSAVNGVVGMGTRTSIQSGSLYQESQRKSSITYPIIVTTPDDMRKSVQLAPDRSGRFSHVSEMDV